MGILFSRKRRSASWLSSAVSKAGPGDALNLNCSAGRLVNLLLRLANLFKDGDVNTKFIETFLNDLVNSQGKGRNTWSSNTKSLFALLLDYGGPMVCELVAKNFGGPSVSSVYREARSEKAVAESLTSDSFKVAKVFYDKLGYKGLFSLAIDATATAQIVRCRGNRIIGYAKN